MYEHVNHMHLVHFCHLYKNGIHIFLCCYQNQFKLENIQQHYLPFIIVYFFPNVKSVFLYRLFRWIFLHSLSLTLYCFSCNSVETIISGLPTFHWTKNPDLSKMKWQFFCCGNLNIFMKDICYFLTKNRTFLRH